MSSLFAGFIKVPETDQSRFPIWVIYDHPKDIPNSFVARLLTQPPETLLARLRKRHPTLAKWIERLASGATGLSLSEWTVFLGSLNAAISADAARIEALEAALEAKGATPEGFVLVPKEPTRAMLEAAETALATWRKTLDRDEAMMRSYQAHDRKFIASATPSEKHAIRWSAMLQAAPPQPIDGETK